MLPDGVFARLCEDGIESSFSDKEILWHFSCYASYTSLHNIQHASNPDAANAENDTRQSLKVSSEDQPIVKIGVTHRLVETLYLQKKKDLQKGDRNDLCVDI